MDEIWIPKISDFGMARIFGGSPDQEKGTSVVGIYGYMAPEYAMRGRFSKNSDVERNTGFYIQEFSLCLLSCAWKLWNEGNVGETVDNRIRSLRFHEQVEMMKCIHIGFLCVQESTASTPTM